jgi:hypothetical protein
VNGDGKADFEIFVDAPIIAEGTEFSAKVYWNNYLENPRTHYLTGDVINIDYAITEHIGRFQIGVAGFYATQIEDDELFDVSLPNLQGEVLQIGPVLGYDMPERGAAMKVKALASVHAINTVHSWGVVVGWIKKF